jgi:hypothetical protein
VSKSTSLELQDLVTVHTFYLGLLNEVVGHPVPVPQEVKEFDPAPESVHHSITAYRRWLAILDMAISPPMVRDALKRSTKYESAEALLRYYMRKGAPSDREKADFVVTFLFRSRKKPAANAAFEAVQQSATDVLEFEAELYKIMGDMKPPELPAEHLQLVKEFEFIEQEVDEFRHFDALMDSGIVQRVREIKQALGPSVYHPHALATLAVYNAFFGQRFEQLFKDATEQIKTFAAKVQQEGGSIMSRIEGDVIVKHLAEVEEAKLLKQEYGAAMESFRKVSKYKKAVDSRRFTRGPGAAAGAPPQGEPQPTLEPVPGPAEPMLEPIAAGPESAAHGHTPVHTPVPRPVREQGPPSGKHPVLGPSGHQPGQPPSIAASPQVRELEDGKIRGVQASIRSFMHSADPKTVRMVPLRNASVPLTVAEAEAFHADYQGEKSFRADYVEMVMHLAAIRARMLTELADYKAKKSSAYLWKPHADSLAYLLTAAEMAMERAKALGATASQRGLADKMMALQETSDRVREQMQVVAKALQA